ncbi:kinase-like domain-containing protein [Umbelopsis sp. AD052]|nr:kinase-like domain-containing protein [Umbelopsis sp. AD052]
MRYHEVQIDRGKETFTIRNKYRFVRKIGSGAYGTVCSVVNIYTGDVIAIKKVHHIFDRKLTTKRCLREIKLLQHFNGHPRIIDIRELDIVDHTNFNEIYLAQQCCDTTLADVIHSSQPLEEVHFQWFLYQILAGLKYIHSADVLHRDLKPANILVNQNCDIRICDFGMARGHIDDHNYESWNLTQYVSTRWYRAPEIMLSRNSYNKSIDVWSLGCIFGEMLGRKVLFKGSDYVDQLHKIVAILGLPQDTSFWNTMASPTVIEYIHNLRSPDGSPPPTDPVDFRSLYPQCSPNGIDILTQMLHLDPAKRITVDQALRHPYLADFRDPEEEYDCPMSFAFEPFEKVDSIDELRELIMKEVHAFEANRSISSMSTGSSRRRYTGSSIATRRSTQLAEANEYAVASINENTSLFTNQSQLVGEPEDMIESDNEEPPPPRRIVGPSHADLHDIERQLSGIW